MSLKESIDKVKKRVEELLQEVKETRKSSVSLVRSVRPRIIRSVIEEKMQSFRPLKKLVEKQD